MCCYHLCAYLQARIGADDGVLDVAAVLYSDIVHEHAVNDPAHTMHLRAPHEQVVQGQPPKCREAATNNQGVTENPGIKLKSPSIGVSEPHNCEGISLQGFRACSPHAAADLAQVPEHAALDAALVAERGAAAQHAAGGHGGLGAQLACVVHIVVVLGVGLGLQRQAGRNLGADSIPARKHSITLKTTGGTCFSI